MTIWFDMLVVFMSIAICLYILIFIYSFVGLFGKHLRACYCSGSIRLQLFRKILENVNFLLHTNIGNELFHENYLGKSL